MAECAAEKFAQKLLGESAIEAVLQRLDRLTQDEARMTGAQTLSVVYGLVGSMKAVMEGTEWLHIQSYLFEDLFVQMARRRRPVFDRIWVRVSRGRYRPC